MSTTMPRMHLYLLGPPRVEIDGQEISFPRRKSLALLAYLAVIGGAQQRDTLATLLWPESSQSRARGALRQELFSMRRTLGAEWLATDGNTVALQPYEEIWLDVHAFEEGVALSSGKSIQPERVATVTALYRDDFLSGFTLEDSPGFDEWQFFRAESLRSSFASVLEQLIGILSDQGNEENAIAHARRWLALDLLHEPAHRCLMQLYARAGQQAAALRQYEICRQTLADELGVPPTPETTALYEQIRARKVGPDEDDKTLQVVVEAPSQPEPLSTDSIPPVPRPAFLDDEAKTTESEQDAFVERERELAQLDGFLTEALAGHGQVVFITGSAGQGKTSLMREFVARAQSTHASLLVASGSCSAYAGVGDPYLPFRDVMEMLAGAVEAKWAAGVITRQHARRLWQVLPETAEILIEAGPDLIDIFVRGKALVGRAAAVVAPDESAWVKRLNTLVTTKQVGHADLEQSYLFEQYVRVLQNLAARHPLLLTLDDLQWADIASISLLFHLGRRIGTGALGARILIVGAYRPEEVALGWDGDRHPLQKVLGEFKRTFGDNRVELAQGKEDEGRRFVDVLLDTQANRLAEGFRQALFRQTAGHPLFTIELLRAMQARGDLIQDEEGCWIEGLALDWQTLPARVEAVIEERLGRLDAGLYGILAVASVEGETFTPAVVAQVQGLDQLQLLRHLSQELGKRHRLVQEEGRAGRQLLSRYRFSHVLFQRYLYDNLGSGERRHLHAAIAQALEELYAGQTDDVAAQLLQQFLYAEVQEKAIEYARLAARRAVAVYAYDEAIQHLQVALDLLENGEQAETQLALLEELADVYRLLREGAQAISRFQAALEQWSSLTGADEMIAVRLHRKIIQTVFEVKFYAEFGQFEALSQTLAVSQAYLESSLILAEGAPAQLELVHVLTTLATETGIGHAVPFDLVKAESYAQAAVELAEELDAPVVLSDALEILAKIQFARGQRSELLEVSYRRLALSHDPRFSDVRKRIGILEHLGNALILAGEYPHAMPYLLEAEALATQIGAVGLQAWALNYQAICWFRLDRWDEILEVDEKRKGLEQRYSRERIGPICLEISVSAATWALKGNLDMARVLRERAYAMMLHLSGGSSAKWVRTHYY